MKIIALCDTWLKKKHDVQADQLDTTEKVFVQKDRVYNCEKIEERALQVANTNHSFVELSHNSGSWYIYNEHWELPWTKPLVTPNNTVIYEKIDWTDFAEPISKYFTVGEVALYQQERLPTTETIKKNAYRIAQELDKVREWWGSGLLVNSWYRPHHVEQRVGGSGANHPYGYAVDIRPAVGSVHDLQHKFGKEWYNTGRWKGGYGRGSRKGFIHLDLRHKRVWDY